MSCEKQKIKITIGLKRNRNLNLHYTKPVGYSVSKNVKWKLGNRIGVVGSPEMPEKSTKMLVLSGNRIGNRVGN